MKTMHKGNFLELVPNIPENFVWKCDDSGLVTFEKENKGVFNRLAQLIIRKPKVSYIHLDEYGSFVWQQIDGVRNITDIGVAVKEHFGEKVEPLYERLATYFKTLESYNFIVLA